MGKAKTLVVGTGRCGTTFLIQLLTQAGCDTGLIYENNTWYTDRHQRVGEIAADGEVLSVIREPERGKFVTYDAEIRAGCEYHIACSDSAETIANELPEYIKNPRLAMSLGKLLSRGLIKVRHVIVPTRDLDDVALSKKQLFRYPDQPFYAAQRVELWQQSAQQLGALMTTLGQYDIPFTLLSFPRMVLDPDYLFAKLQPVCGFERVAFDKAFQEIAQPAFVTLHHTQRTNSPPDYMFTEDWARWFRKNMQALAAQRDLTKSRYLEIGVYEGRSAVFMLLNVLRAGGSYTGIDWWTGMAETERIARANVAKAATAHNLPARLIRQRSDVALQQLAGAGEQFDLIYVDGSHEYLDTLRDSELAWSMLAPGGVMLWDDVGSKQFATPRAVQEFTAAHHLPAPDLDQWQHMVVKPG